jgi:hypothetical protein
VLVQLAFFGSHISRHAAGSTVQQQQQWQRRAVTISAAATAVLATAGRVPVDELAASGQGQITVRQDAAALPVAEQPADGDQGKAAPALLHSSSSNTKHYAAAAASAGSALQGTNSQASIKLSQPTAAPNAAADAHCTLPYLTTSLLDFDVWATSQTTAAGSSSSSTNSTFRSEQAAAKAAAGSATAVFSEREWLVDLQMLLPQAQQHL